MNAVRRSTIAAIWLGGAALAVALYLVGPWDVTQSLWAGLDRLQQAVGGALGVLFSQGFDFMHAVALALFAVFLVLAALASARGVRAGGVAGVTALFVGLIWIGGYQSRLCWFAALLVALSGAVHMTQRLLAPPPRRA
ncbi:MAG TPA: hypothetical protein VFA03_05455 [Acetobacteraceae bacterium]|nr:hypothetical protein [Acetobacteraceae bacterium]